MRANAILASILFVCSIPALCQISVVVNSPAASATVGIPFVLTATAGPCSGQPISAMGYSLNYGATTIVNAASINALVTASAGAQTLHVKSWGNQGAACDTDVPITVSASLLSGLLPNATATPQRRRGSWLVARPPVLDATRSPAFWVSSRAHPAPKVACSPPGRLMIPRRS